MRQRNIFSFGIILMSVILAGYVYVYQTSPFSETWNSVLIYAADPFAALLAAIAVTAVLTYYHTDDKSYPIWLWFTLGMWAWFLAESAYSFIAFTSGEAPALGFADVLWFIGYAMVSVALYKQYSLIDKTKAGWWKLIVAWVGVILLAPLVLFLLQSPFSAENFIAYLYPLVDFAICLVSFRLYLAFGGGKLSRPWIGLFVLGISDAIWAWLAAGGGDQASWLGLFGDTCYVAAYLILAVGFLMQYLLLRFGPE